MFALEISSISKPRFSFPRMTDLIKPRDELRHKALTHRASNRGWRHDGRGQRYRRGEIVKPSLFILSWKRRKKKKRRRKKKIELEQNRLDSTRLDGLFQNINALNLLWTLVASLWTLLCSLQWSGEHEEQEYIYIYIYKNGMKRMMRRLEYRDRINRIVFAKFQRKFEGMIPRRRAN